MEVPIVHPAKCEIRPVIRFLHAKGTPSVDIRRQLTEVYGEKCMSTGPKSGAWSLVPIGKKSTMKNGVDDRQFRRRLSDIASIDYHLIPKLKEHLGGQRFRRDDDDKEDVKHFLNGLAAEFYDSEIQKLEHRLEKCVEKDGDCVGK